MTRRRAHLGAEDRLLDLPEVPETSVPRYLSAVSVARLLDVSPSWIRDWNREGLLRGFVLHAVPGDRGRLVFRESDVRDFLLVRGLSVGDEGV